MSNIDTTTVSKDISSPSPALKRTSFLPIVILYTAAIVLGEVMSVVVAPEIAVWGVLIHVAVILALIIHSALATNLSPDYRRLFLALSLVPMVRVISLTIPLMGMPQFMWYPVIYSPLIAAAIVAIRISGYQVGSVGLKTGFVPAQIFIGLSGFGLGAVEYWILRPPAIIPQLTLINIIPMALVFLIFVGFGEEFIFRGVLQKSAIDILGKQGGIIYVSFLFAILHMGFHSVLDVVFVFAVAAFFAWLVKRTGSLWGVTIAHGITNTMLYMIMPFIF